MNGMNDEIPHFNRNPVVSQDSEIWRPSWHCYCCRDTGLVQDYLVKRVIPNYNAFEDKPVVCQRCGAYHRGNPVRDLNHDWRFKRDLCDRLDQISRHDWQTTTQQHFQLVQRIIQGTTGHPF
jgi:hypothetical protein